MQETQTRQGFSALGIPPNLLQKIERFGFDTPTPIQARAIPEGLLGKDLIGIAQTGTGKTLAFGIPMIARLRHIEIGLVLAPTRELALQIQETYRTLGVKTALLIGGAPMGKQVSDLRGRPAVIIATPGRFKDHMDRGTIMMRGISVVVLDEADRMLDMGFAPVIRQILDATPPTRQTMLFSATMPREIEDLAQRYLRSPLRIEMARSGTTAENIEQELMVVHKEDKPELLKHVLSQHAGTVLVFTRTRHGARKLARTARMFGHSTAELHSDRTLAQRTAALKGFKSGEFRILIATDIAARGIDVKDIGLVLNYDVPQNPEDYVHRIGRTARAGASGKAITFASPDQHRDVRDIEKLMKTEMPISKDSRLALPPARGQSSSRPSRNRSAPPRGHFDRSRRPGTQRASWAS